MHDITKLIFSVEIIPAVMVFIVSSAVIGKLILFYLKRGTLYFTSEFGVRVKRYLRGEYQEVVDKKFADVVRYLVNKTYYDIYELRRQNQRRRFDTTKVFLDSLFLLDDGAQTFFDDIADQASYIGDSEQVDWNKFIGYVFARNPVFNHMFGIIPIRLVNAIYRLLPWALLSLGGIGAIYSWGGEWSSFLVWGISSAAVVTFFNLVFSLEYYEQIARGTIGWNMFLLWSRRKERQTATGVDEERLEDSFDLIAGHEFAKATAETFALVENDSLPELPELPEVDKAA